MGFSPFHWLILIAPLVAAAAVLVIVLRRPRQNDLLDPPRTAARVIPRGIAAPHPEPAAAPAPMVSLPEDVATKVWVELRPGKVINAVKLVHDSTDLNLKDSKALVDDMRLRDPDLR